MPHPLRNRLLLLFTQKKIAAGPWWLSGGISAANCIAAYQPKGAASYAASKTNLANPGTYTAAPGRDCSWDATRGWIFNGIDQYLTTGINPATGAWSMIIRFDNVNTTITGSFKCACGADASSSFRFYIAPVVNAGDVRSYGVGGGAGGFVNVTGKLASGVMSIAGANCYLNGSPDGTASNSDGGVSTVVIGATHPSGLINSWLPGDVQAFAIYNTTITGPQQSALYIAISAL